MMEKCIPVSELTKVRYSSFCQIGSYGKKFLNFLECVCVCASNGGTRSFRCLADNDMGQEGSLS